MANMTSNQIGYPSGLSPNLASKLSEVASQADATNGQLSNGIGSLSGVTSEVSNVVSQITSTSQGQFVTALGGFWNGGGAAGGGGAFQV